jgi:membrane associated rhomboid family serine protease
MLGQNTNIRIGGPITPVVKNLLVINGIVFLIQEIAGMFYPNLLEYLFGLHHIGLVHEFKLWQIFTYMFLHGGWLHIILNMLGLWMFAGELEQLWGSKLFLRYYLFSGMGAGLFIAVMNYIAYAYYQINVPTIGASGAIYAVLLAYGMTWPDRKVIIFPLFIPVKIKYMVLIFGLISFFGALSAASGTTGNISHIGHLGGIISGFAYIMMRIRRRARAEGDRPGKMNFISAAIKKARIKRKKKEIDTRIQAKQIIDRLLEKIARQGMSSLTASEKNDLEWARKHYYPNDGDILH